MRVIGSATTGRDGLDGPDLGLQRILLGLSEHHDECDPGVVEPLLRLRNAARRLLEARVNPCVYLRLLARPTSLAGLYFRPTPTPPCPRWCCVDRLNLLPHYRWIRFMDLIAELRKKIFRITILFWGHGEIL